MKKNIISFNVINFEFNSGKFEAYDVMPFFIRCYRDENKDKRPVTYGKIYNPELIENYKIIRTNIKGLSKKQLQEILK